MPAENGYRKQWCGSILISVVCLQSYFQGFSPGALPLEDQSSTVKDQELELQLCT